MIRLQSDGPLVCEIEPQLGGSIAGLWLGDVAVLQLVRPHVPAAGGFVPTVRRPARGIDADCASLDVDHCFDGWTGVVTLRDEVLHSCVGSDLRRLVVFTHASRDTIAIEPVSHVNNAINLVAAGADAADLGLHTLQPGETLAAQMSIEVEAAR